MENKMFCFQCEQTAGCSGCTGKAGVCGKSALTAKLQDQLTGALISLAKKNEINEVNTKAIIEGLFTSRASPSISVICSSFPARLKLFRAIGILFS